MRHRDKFISNLVADALDGLALYLERRAQQQQVRNPLGTQYPCQVGAYSPTSCFSAPSLGAEPPRKEPLKILEDLE